MNDDSTNTSGNSSPESPQMKRVDHEGKIIGFVMIAALVLGVMYHFFA